MITATPHKKHLSTIVVDLTPVLPEGDNGGAKVFVLHLIKKLADLAPQTQFILLTQSIAHEELCALESINIRCKQVVTTRKQKWTTLSKFLFRLQHIPIIKPTIRRFYFFMFDKLKQRHTKNLLKNLNADLLFCPFTAPTYAKKEIPTISIIHDLQYKTYPHFFSEEGLFQRDYTFIQACKKTHTLVAVSDYSRQSVLQTKHIPADRVQTIHIQMAQRMQTTFNPDPLILKRLQLTPQRYLLYPANFWKHKNHEMLLTAFQMFLNQYPNQDPIKLVCTGAPGERQQWLIKAVQTMGLESKVLFPGFLCTDNLSILMTNAAGVIFPSLYEGFGLPVIEAMAAGIPVACSNLRALPEVSDNAALLFNPTLPNEIASALQTLVFDQKRRAELIALGHARAAEFSDETQMAKQYWDVFLKAIEAH